MKNKQLNDQAAIDKRIEQLKKHLPEYDNSSNPTAKKPRKKWYVIGGLSAALIFLTTSILIWLYACRGLDWAQARGHAKTLYNEIFVSNKVSIIDNPKYFNDSNANVKEDLQNYWFGISNKPKYRSTSKFELASESNKDFISVIVTYSNLEVDTTSTIRFLPAIKFEWNHAKDWIILKITFYVLNSEDR